MKQTKRKLLSLFTAMLAVVLLLSLAGCGGSGGSGGTSSAEAEELDKTTYVYELAGFKTTWTFTKSEMILTYDDPSGTDIDATGKYWLNDEETQITFQFNASAEIALIPGLKYYIVPSEWLSGKITLPFERISENQIKIGLITYNKREKT